MSNITYNNKNIAVNPANPTADEKWSAANANEVKTAVNSKVDQVDGKGLSANDYTTTEKNKLANQSGTNTGDQDLTGLQPKESGKGLSSNDYTTTEKNKLAQQSGVNTGDQDLSGKVDKVTGKQLSTNDYTNEDKAKLIKASTAIIDRVGIPGLGLEVGAPSYAATGTIALINQRAVFIYFKVQQQVTVNAITMASDNTVAATGVVTARYGIYAMSEDNEAYPLGRSTNDTTLFSVAATRYTKVLADGWASSVTLIPNRTYAASVVIDSTGAMPLLVAQAATRTAIQPSTLSKRTGVALELPAIWGDNGQPWNNWFQTPWAVLNVAGTTNIAKTVVLLGDSYFDTYGDWFGLGNAQSGGKLHPTMNAGIGGQTLSQISARWETDVLPYSPECVYLNGGTNDLHSEFATAATIISRFDGIIAKASTAKIPLIINTPSPNTSSSPTAKTNLGLVRTYLLGLTLPNVYVIDTGMALSTGDGVTADASKMVDGVHPNTLGFTAMAPVVAAFNFNLISV